MTAETKAKSSSAAPGILAAAMGVMSVATYGFQIVASRLLGPEPFGAFAAVMNVLLLVGVGQLALQATAARRISAAPDQAQAIEHAVLGLTYRLSLALGLALLLLAPVIKLVLRLDGYTVAVLIGIIAVPQTIMGGQAGVLQGARRWKPLAMLYLASGVPRLVIGGLLIMIRPDEMTAIIGVALGALAPVAVGFAVLGRTGHGAPAGPSIKDLLVETGHKSTALLAFIALCNVDLIVARNVLSENDAGQYAAGLILTKAVLFLPQFVVVIAFPSLATAAERRRALVRGLLTIGGFGAATALGVFLLPDVALLFVGGSSYSPVKDELWLFAILGLLLAMIQMLVYSVLATEGRRLGWLPWLAVVAVAVAGSESSSVDELLLLVISANAVLTAGLLALAGRAARSAPTPTPTA